MGSHSNSWASMWEVFVLFAVPVGGGIPAGVVLAEKRGIVWPTMVILYLISDIALAFLFEPFMMLVTWAAKHYEFVARMKAALKKSTNKTISKYGVKPGPFTLVLIAFGVDPMTGRAAALAAGHGFLSGWTIAILGDLIFFLLLMVSTLCLNNFLGDGTWTAVIIMVAMIVVPSLIRRLREWWRAK